MDQIQAELLASLWGEDPASPFRADPWKSLRFGQLWAVRQELMDRPDLGWAMAMRLAKCGRRLPVNEGESFTLIDVAISLINGGGKKHEESEVQAVRKAWGIHEANGSRVLLEAMLLTLDATAESVAEVLGIEVEVVQVFSELFFNVLDRKEDLRYLSRIVQAAAPDDQELLGGGLNGTVDDVLYAEAGRRNSRLTADPVGRQ